MQVPASVRQTFDQTFMELLAAVRGRLLQGAAISVVARVVAAGVAMTVMHGLIQIL